MLPASMNKALSMKFFTKVNRYSRFASMSNSPDLSMMDPELSGVFPGPMPRGLHPLKLLLPPIKYLGIILKVGQLVPDFLNYIE